MMRYRRMLACFGCAAILLLPLAQAGAQANLPNENHYKVYQVLNPLSTYYPLTLTDQFGTNTVTNVTLDKFANPAAKRHTDGTISPIVDPDAHQTWWKISVPQPSRTVIAIDQFGTRPWVLGNATYLLLPALKNVQYGHPPVRNHYLCYEAIGPTQGIPVLLTDQFGDCNVVVLYGKYFCNPVEKRNAGAIYPIVDYYAHLTCYTVDNPTLQSHFVYSLDQFRYAGLELGRNDCLCNPAIKETVLGTEQSTWGKVKALYR